MPILSFAVGKHSSCVVDLLEARIIPLLSSRLAIRHSAPIGVLALTECVDAAAGGGSAVELEIGIESSSLSNCFLDGAVEYHAVAREDLEFP